MHHEVLQAGISYSAQPYTLMLLAAEAREDRGPVCLMILFLHGPVNYSTTNWKE